MIKKLIFVCLFFLTCSKIEREKTLFNKDSGGDWPIFRANQQLTGCIKENVPESPTLLWTFKTGAECKSSPVIAMERVFIGSSDGKVYALNFHNGEKLWEYDTGGAVEAPPLFLDSLLYVGSLSGSFFALDAVNGQVKWQYKTKNRICGSANWWDNHNEKWVIFGSYDNMLYCLNSKTGALKWAFETENFINGAPAISRDVVVVGGCDARLNMISAEKGVRVGQVDVGSYIPSSPAIEDDCAYLGHYGNQLICVEMKQQKITWKYGDEENGDAFFSSPAVGMGKVVIGGRDKNLHCVNQQNGTQAWCFQTRGEVDSSPVICGNTVVCASKDGRIYVLSLASGQLKWSYEIGAPISCSPAVSHGSVVIGGEDGQVYLFGANE
jgi:eukaryotic-like serine/threonine-protein kinase